MLLILKNTVHKAMFKENVYNGTIQRKAVKLDHINIITSYVMIIFPL